MSPALPPEPEFGAPLAVPPVSQAVLSFLALRRSTSAGLLRGPAPNAAELRDMLRLAARVPDHGKLAPWRFIILEGEPKLAFETAVETIAAQRPEPDRLKAALFKLKAPPLTVVVVSRTVENKIPAWEQQLSAGAVCMSLLNAAHAVGFGANWITDWYAYDEGVDALLGLGQGERVAGYVHIGAQTEPSPERARPDLAAITSWWAP
jgi:nitroreductase